LPKALPPPITRVHTLYRLRTIVNAVGELNLKKAPAGDQEIAEVLAKRRLSKLRLKNMKDRIQRRARDHLLTATDMGLLTREGRPFNYIIAPCGSLLKSYRFVDECPKDPTEKAVFIDRILRLKLTNPYDMQLSQRYREYRSRPVLFTLTLLSLRPLHLYELALALTEKNCDSYLNRQLAEKYAALFERFEPYKAKSVRQIQRKFSISPQRAKSMRRNVGPLLDWCEQLGLISSSEDWYDLSGLGKAVEGKYSESVPVWYFDLGSTPKIKASLLSTYAILSRLNMNAPAVLKNQRATGVLTNETFGSLLQDIQSRLRIGLFDRDLTALNVKVDFDPYYDVPPQDRAEVLGLVRQQLKLVGASTFFDQTLQIAPIEELRKSIDDSESVLKNQLAFQFKEQTNRPAPKEIIPTPGLFKSPFETVTCILLRLMGFKADKYQGALADYCSDPTVRKIAQDNPDMLVENGITCLVECKSADEWKSPIRLRKAIKGEIMNYQDYAEDVRANSALIVCEGTPDRDDFVEPLVSLFDRKAKLVVLATRDRLTACLNYPADRTELQRKMLAPLEFDGRSRMLT
jgi:hypothetical protein